MNGNPGSKGAALHPSQPRLGLPKGGGAIRGIGEKFAANPVTGTGSMTVPIAVSPGRAGFGPALSLSYDSGAGNGPFGFGWSLALPAITRKTDKGLPRYADGAESDVFVLVGRRGPRAGAASASPAASSRAATTRDGRRRDLRGAALPAAHRGAVRPHRALDRAQPIRRTTLLALDLARQRHHLVRHGRRRAGSPTRPTRAASSAG